jgi:bifunctional DNA-binding transcriptional regulator/antitoxin component of YhaV-PrlF toxin-antitoxin module
MLALEKAEVVVVSTKGQVVIPQYLRQRMKIGVKTKLLIYPYEDALIMKKLDVNDVEKKLRAIYRRIKSRADRYGALDDSEINSIVQRYRHAKR